MLVIMAHIKLFMIQKAVIDVYDTLDMRLMKLATYVDELQQVPVTIEDHVEVKQGLDPEVLQIFYGLSEQGRKAFFTQVANLLHGEAFEFLWHACFKEQGPIQRAADVQKAFMSIDLQTYSSVKHVLQNLKVDQTEEKQVVEETAKVLETPEQTISETVDEAPQQSKKKKSHKKRPSVIPESL